MSSSLSIITGIAIRFGDRGWLAEGLATRMLIGFFLSMKIFALRRILFFRQPPEKRFVFEGLTKKKLYLSLGIVVQHGILIVFLMRFLGYLVLPVSLVCLVTIAFAQTVTEMPSHSEILESHPFITNRSQRL